MKNIRLLILLPLMLFNLSCFDLVEEGIVENYPLSDATLVVEPISSEQGAVDQIISYQITVESIADIKSCIIQSNNDGQNGSGFNVNDPAFDDPFIDHIFGTIQKNTRSFTVRYDYIIPENIKKNRLTFSIIDEMGKVSVEKTIEVVPDIELYTDQELYARNSDFHDAFASIEGQVYPDIKTNYSTLSTENVEIQEKIDIIFYYDENSKQSFLAAPSSEKLGLSLSVENQTSFKNLSGLGDLNLAEVTASTLVELTKDAEIISEGATQITNIKTGDIIGFVTDLNATHSLKTGLLKITGLHPSNVPHYSGIAYVLECEIIVQK